MKTLCVHTLVLAGLLVAGSAWALPGETPAPAPKPREVVRQKIVIVDKDGKEHVYDSEGPSVRRGYLGVGLVDLTPELRRHFGAPDDAGVMVSNVEDGSPADKAGIQVGDILTSLDGKDVESSWDIRSRVRELKEGEQAALQVWRDGKAQSLSATIALRERPELDMGPILMRGDGEHAPMAIEIDRDRLLPREGMRAPMAMVGPRSAREAELEKRLKELEKRLADLEKMLEKK
ncbi:MAG TPA: PDZ domain-containing protein [Thermoanaerobaculia bacterium]|jgi:membrane-associated protease RseP (regulator of RpoE activity)|nr:PDZ domain-containing protein [Thermoanaerobaculia bacterium]